MMKKIQYNSPVVLNFTLLSLGALVLGILTNNFTTALFFSIYRSPLNDPLAYLRLFGHVLGHADWEHFFGNFIIILLIGPMLEEKYGSKTMIIMIVLTAFMTGILNIILFPSALLGASGIVFMMILLSSFANVQEGKIPLTLILIVIVFIGREIVDGILANDNISQITHIIGGLCGGIFGFYIDKDHKINKTRSF